MADTTGAHGGTSLSRTSDLPAYLSGALACPPAVMQACETAPRCEFKVMRDEVLDGRSRIVGYRFRTVATGDGPEQSCPITKLNALKADRLASFAQHRMAVIPITADEWRALDYRQFVTPNVLFHVALPQNGGTSAWLWTLEDIRDCGAGVALDSTAMEPSFADGLRLADIVFANPECGKDGALAEMITALRQRHPAVRVAVDGVRSWREYRACLDVGADYCMGPFTALPFEPDEAQDRTVVESVLNCKLVQFAWYRVFECGNEDIDGDHRALFALAGELLNGIVTGKPRSRLLETVELLMQTADLHFVREEAALRMAGYAKVVEHSALHRALSDKAARMVADFKAGDVEIGPVFEFLAEDLIVKHMLGADREFFPLFARQGAAASPAA